MMHTAFLTHPVLWSATLHIDEFNELSLRSLLMNSDPLREMRAATATGWELRSACRRRDKELCGLLKGLAEIFYPTFLEWLSGQLFILFIWSLWN